MYRIKTITSILLLILLFVNGFSQKVEDDISEAVKNPPSPFFRFDAKNSIISNSGAKIWGLNLGLDYDNTFKYGVGFYGLSSIVKKNFYETSNGITDTINTRLKFFYLSLFAEYVFYKSKHWQASMPIQIGVGSTRFRGMGDDDKYIYNQKPIILYEATLTGHYRFLRYFAIGGGVGYRIMLLNNKTMDMQLTNPIYILKFKFFIGDVYKDVAGLF